MSIALVLIDLQNDYFPGGAMELVGSEVAVERARELLLTFRWRSLPVVHVQHVATKPTATFFRPGTRGVEIHDAVRPEGHEPVVVKHHPSSFRDTTLLATLREAGATDLVFAGMMTHMCVDTTVRAAADLGFTCSLASDACATRDLEFGGRRVGAAEVQLAYLAALDGSFAAVRPARELAAA